MKCIYCNSDTTYPVRRGNGGRCGSCQHSFAFEPKTDLLRVSDGLFAALIKKVSSDGTLHYTEKHLGYEFNRKTAKKRISCGASSLIWLMALPASHALGKHGLLLAFAFAAIATLAAATVKSPPKQKPPQYAPSSLAKFQTDYLKKWIAAHGEPDHMLLEPSSGSLPGVPTEDVSAFSFDRALITETASMAAMLVANNFHFENNCAILSLNKYPFGRFDTIYQMLQRNPQLTVFCLHSATTTGCTMSTSLRSQNWFPDPTIRIIDLGLRPLHAIKSNMILIKGAAPAPVNTTSSSSFLKAEELEWLGQGNIAEVENVRPAKLMRAIYQGFARAAQTTVTNGDYIDDTGVVIWMYDPAIDIYAADSFG